MLPPMVVLQALAKNPHLTLAVVKGYIERQLTQVCPPDAQLHLCSLAAGPSLWPRPRMTLLHALLQSGGGDTEPDTMSQTNVILTAGCLLSWSSGASHVQARTSDLQEADLAHACLLQAASRIDADKAAISRYQGETASMHAQVDALRIQVTFRPRADSCRLTRPQAHQSSFAQGKPTLQHIMRCHVLTCNYKRCAHALSPV